NANVCPNKINDQNLRNSFGSLDNDDEEFWTHSSDLNNATLNVINESDSEEVDEELVVESDNRNDTLGASTPINEVFRYWSWASNSSSCLKGTKIILGWNSDVVDISIIFYTDQAMHTRIWIKAERKEFFLFIYLCSQSDTVVGSSIIDISMREFRECIDDIELMDVPRAGLQFTWNQKPQGNNGILKKLDRVMENVAFSNGFVGNYAVFNPYGISDHSPAVLRIPVLKKHSPKPFKFSNVVTSFPRFKEIVMEGWSTPFHSFHMFNVVKRLKLLKKPFRKLLYDKGNLYENVNRLRVEVERVQMDLDGDPFNQHFRDEEAVYVRAFNDALIMKEQFLKQKAKVEWIKVGDSNSAYFHKAVKGRISRNRIDVVTDNGGNVITGDGVPSAFVTHYEAF
nr:hypothetical protein [Tanacetum cinerariifolium]